MAELMKADIFFFITTIAVIVLTVAAVVFIIYLIGIMRNVRDISEILKDQSKQISNDVTDLRQAIRSEGMKLKHFTDFMKKPHQRKKKSTS